VRCLTVFFSLKVRAGVFSISSVTRGCGSVTGDLAWTAVELQANDVKISVISVTGGMMGSSIWSWLNTEATIRLLFS
jgi:hypothetical protein